MFIFKYFRDYAEEIEKQLKMLGIRVDLLFPNDSVPMNKVLGNIQSRGCLYAILVTPINKERRSLTLTVGYDCYFLCIIAKHIFLNII